MQELSVDIGSRQANIPMGKVEPIRMLGFQQVRHIFYGHQAH
jgi:hypothetical protein